MPTTIDAREESDMDLQPRINIGTLGHVAHGKTSIVRNLTNVDPIKHEAEKQNNCTIRLGYANTKIYKCPKCVRPLCYQIAPKKPKKGVLKCKEKTCDGALELVQHVSFVDCPGHEVLMSTMLNGAAVMDSCIMVVGADAPCPQPQTAEHLVAAEIVGLTSFLMVQNKIDAVTLPDARCNKEEIEAFLKDTVAEGAPIVPVSAMRGYNMDVILEYIANLPPPVRNLDVPGRMIVIRSFDVNTPGTPAREMKGGVAGGSIQQGTFEVGHVVEIRPGLIIRDGSKVYCRPLTTTITSLVSEKTPLKKAFPGGLIGVGTLLDPSLTRGDRLVGQMLGVPGTLPPILISADADVYLLRRLVGAAASSKVGTLKVGEKLAVSVGAKTVLCSVTAAKRGECKGQCTAALALEKPCCADVGQRISVSRKIEGHWRLIGWGTITKGKEAERAPADASA